jgi:hypothetical protein
MNIERFQDWLQILGLAGVIVSLVFVGRQLELDRRIAIGDAWLQYADTQVSVASLIGENADIWLAGLAGEELSETDELRFRQIAYAIEQSYGGRYNRSVLGVRAGPAEGIVIEFAHDLYAHPGLRRVVFNRWDRIEAMYGRDRAFFIEVKSYLARLDKGEVQPAPMRDYVH